MTHWQLQQVQGVTEANLSGYWTSVAFFWAPALKAKKALFLQHSYHFSVKLGALLFYPNKWCLCQNINNVICHNLCFSFFFCSISLSNQNPYGHFCLCTSLQRCDHKLCTPAFATLVSKTPRENSAYRMCPATLCADTPHEKWKLRLLLFDHVNEFLLWSVQKLRSRL